MQSFAIHIIGDIERCPLFNDIERTAIALQFALTSAEGFYLFAVLVIDIVPVFRCLDVAYALSFQTSDNE